MKTFIISDTHFGHMGMVKFLRKDGSKQRPWETIEEHDEALVNNWNKTVSSIDKVYHLGDVGFKNSTRTKEVLSRLNGTKVLIKGNHDTLKLSAYQELFKDVRAYHSLDKILLAHIPVHPQSLGRWRGQIHGHTHAINMEDKRYFNASCEQINYTPIDWEQIRTYYKELELGT